MGHSTNDTQKMAEVIPFRTKGQNVLAESNRKQAHPRQTSVRTTSHRPQHSADSRHARHYAATDSRQSRHCAPTRRRRTYVGPANRAKAHAKSAKSRICDLEFYDDEVTRLAPFVMLMVLVFVGTIAGSWRMDDQLVANIDNYAYIGSVMYFLDGAAYGALGALLALPFVLLAPIAVHALIWRKIDQIEGEKIRYEDKFFALTGTFPETFSLEERQRREEREAQAV